jgi:hypothetical protein
MTRSIHIVREKGLAGLATRARALGAADVEVWRAVEGPPVPPEFRSVGGRPSITAVVSVRHADLAWHRALSGEGEGYVVEQSLVFERGPMTVRALTRIGSQSRAPGLTRDGFARHWREVHAPLVERHQPGIVRYVQNVVVEQLYGEDHGVDGFHESTFADVDAYRDRLFDSAEGRHELGADTRLLLADPAREERVFVVSAAVRDA